VSGEANAAVELSESENTGPGIHYHEWLASDQGAKEDPELGGVVVWRHRQVGAVALDTDTYSSAFLGTEGPRYMGHSPEPFSDEVEALLAQYYPEEPALLVADPPIHTRHRMLVAKPLGSRRIRLLTPEIEAVTNELIDSFIDKGQCDIVADFAVPLPLTIISDALGVDRADHPKFKHWSDMQVAGTLEVLDNTQRAEVARAIIAMQGYLLPLIEDRRANPRDDLMSDLVSATIDDPGIAGPRQLTTGELLPIIGQLLVAGNETTAKLIGLATVILLRRPDLLSALQADRSLIPNFLEETLRFDPPVHAGFRVAKEDTEIAGCPVAKGQRVVASWGAAGRDPEVFDDPGTFDLNRANANRHMAFGFGPHLCAGASLARTEARIAFEVLLSRLTEIRLEPGATLRRLPGHSLSGWESVPIEFRRA
jgi:cytochrome P450